MTTRAKPAKGISKRKSLINPRTLMQAGILRDTSTLRGATERARRLVGAGRFHDAHELLRTVMPKRIRPDDPEFLELLGACAIRKGGPWEAILDEASENYASMKQPLASARVLRTGAEAHIFAGNLGLANSVLKKAEATFADHGHTHDQALCIALRARAATRAGYYEDAIAAYSKALDRLQAKAREQALIRIERARALAHAGDPVESTNELIRSARFLSNSSNPHELAAARLARAECLIVQGDTAKAIEGLTRLLPNRALSQDAPTRALIRLLLGRATVGTNPNLAREHLTRSKNLYQKVRSPYGILEAELALAGAENELGLNPLRRLKSLTPTISEEWPVLRVKRDILMAEWIVQEDPDRSRELLLDTRRFSAAAGISWGISISEMLLECCGLVASGELTPITMVANRAS